MNTTRPLSDRQHIAAAAVHAFSVADRAVPAQVAAKSDLWEAIREEDARQITEALHRVVRTFQRRSDGSYLPERINVTVRSARAALQEFEAKERAA